MAGVMSRLNLAPAVLMCTPTSKQDLQVPNGTKGRETIISWAYTLLPGSTYHCRKLTCKPPSHTVSVCSHQSWAQGECQHSEEGVSSTGMNLFSYMFLWAPWLSWASAAADAVFILTELWSCWFMLRASHPSTCFKAPVQHTSVPAAPDPAALCCDKLACGGRERKVGMIFIPGWAVRDGAGAGAVCGAQLNPSPGRALWWGWAEQWKAAEQHWW